ncbi:hypothetical protein AXK12_01460 [Cephaloticoccus capnophilus]|uniref:Ppx/GppA phosphatase N-terminal domain-containing protein n=1 Tax=Cephaloticoccus capnophilus TaxID=1548208 RepID=A0A139SST6_9BACT|nr:hypothetical protein [Cephaloticoccus capnophilus]KXU37633.1 hypothetical protein AXK12_01460 [Cephaloticoccus capnophilus]
MISPDCSPVAVIDIGSNSIKNLIAQRRSANATTSTPEAVEALFSRSIEARISSGADWVKGRSQLAHEAMTAALTAIEALLADCSAYAPAQVALVGTSALRDAANGAEFIDLVRAKTGHSIRILSGAEEAEAIGRGLLCDPTLQSAKTQAQSLYAFDLGGGSLECLALRAGKLVTAQSLPLGSVRLMRRFVKNPEATLAADEREAIRSHVTEAFAHAGFAFGCAPPYADAQPTAIGTGGLWFNVRQMLASELRSPALAAKAGAPAAANASALVAAEPSLAPPFLPRETIEQVLEKAARLPLAERRRLPGISPGRADILPTALTTMLTVLDLGGFSGLQHSTYNLRYGIAAELLATCTGQRALR